MADFDSMDNSMNTNVIIITDSRGRDLKSHLVGQNTQDTVRIDVISHPGAGLELAVLKSLQHLRKHKPQLVIIAAGICDLTWRNRVSKEIGLRHGRVSDNVAQVVNAMKAAYDLIRTEGIPRVTFATLTGLDLADSNNSLRRYMTTEQYEDYCTHSKITPHSQHALNQAILTINRKIILFNRRNSINTVWLAGLVHAYIKGSYHHYYRRLVDGCHLDEKTKASWANQIIKSIKRILN